MTYCMGMLLRDGMLLASDSRTNAGVDQVARFRKMTIWERPSERVIVLMTAGNLAVSQAVVGALNEGVAARGGDVDTMNTVATMTGAARLLGAAIRSVEEADGPALAKRGLEFDVSTILAGQVGNGELRMFNHYSAGNFIEATVDTPFFQIGENKYGKPILDRVVTFETSLPDAAKCALISIDSTLRSNISVGPPIDLLVYHRGELKVATHQTLNENDEYFERVRKVWSGGLLELFGEIDDPPWEGV